MPTPPAAIDSACYLIEVLESPSVTLSVTEGDSYVVATYAEPLIVIDASEAKGLSLLAASDLSGHRGIAAMGGQAVYASNQVLAHADSVLGITESAVVSGGTAEIFNHRLITESSWDWTPNQPVWLGPNGLLTQILSVASGIYLLQVGVAISPTQLYVNIHRPIFF
jgi:hypothetical protein